MLPARHAIVLWLCAGAAVLILCFVSVIRPEFLTQPIPQPVRPTVVPGSPISLTVAATAAMATEKSRNQPQVDAMAQAAEIAQKRCELQTEFINPAYLGSQAIYIGHPTTWWNRKTAKETYIPIGTTVVVHEGLLAVYMDHCADALEAWNKSNPSFNDLVKRGVIVVLP